MECCIIRHALDGQVEYYAEVGFRCRWDSREPWFPIMERLYLSTKKISQKEMPTLDAIPFVTLAFFLFFFLFFFRLCG